MFKTVIVIFVLANIALAKSSLVEAEAQKEELSNGITCELCTFVLNTAQTLLEQNRTDDEIIDFIEHNLCNKLGAQQNNCISYLDANGRTILYQLALDIHPSIICGQIGLCRGTEKPLPSGCKNVGGVLECAICEVVLEEAKILINNNKTDVEIAHFIEENLCIGQSNRSEECKEIVDKYGPLIVKLLIAGVRVKRICEVVGFCIGERSHVQVRSPIADIMSLEKEKLNDSPVCQICIYVMNTAQTLLEQNTTEDEVIDFIKGSLCTNLGPLADQCTKYIDANGRSILYQLGQDIHPSVICGQIGLCRGDMIELPKPIEQSKEQSNPTCQLCIFALGTAQVLLEQNQTEAEIISFIKISLCANLGSLKDQCNSYIDANGKTILYQLGRKIHPSIVCGQLGLCRSESRKNKIETEQKITGPVSPVCKLCTYILTTAQTLLEQNQTEDQIISFIKTGLCQNLGPLTQQCNTYIDANGKTILYQLGQDIHPSIICAQIGLCGATEQKIEEPKTLKNDVTPSCKLCMYVLSAAQQLLEKNQTEEEIILFIEKALCSNLGSLRDSCVQYLEANGKNILYQLGQDIHPSIICLQLGICRSGEKIEEPKISQIPKENTSPVCQLCIYVLSISQQLLENNSTEDEIIGFIKSGLCGNLGPLQDQCVKYVDANGKTILYQLGQGIHPSIICGQIGLCRSAATEKAENPKNAPTIVQSKITDNASLNCTLCKITMAAAKKRLQQNQTEQQVVKYIQDQLCVTNKQIVDDACRQVLTNYGPTIVKLLAEGAEPEQICQIIGKCPFKPPLNKKALNQPSNVRNNDTLKCIACEYAVLFIDYELKQNSTDAAILSILSRACTLASQDTRAKCQEVIQKHGFTIIELLTQLIEPYKVCEIIGACSARASDILNLILKA